MVQDKYVLSTKVEQNVCALGLSNVDTVDDLE